MTAILKSICRKNPRGYFLTRRVHYNVRKMVTFVCVLTDVYGALTTKPQNALVLRGQDAFLNCSSPMGIHWDHDLGLIFTSPCKPTHSKSFAATASDSSTCNIRAVGSNPNGISGEYRCSDTTEKAVAIVIVLGEWHNIIYIYFKVTHNRRQMDR